MIFNPDMTARLAALHEAAQAGEQIHARFLGPSGGERSQPARVTVHLTRGRTLVFAAGLASQVADQLDENGLADAATIIRSEAAKAS